MPINTDNGGLRLLEFKREPDRTSEENKASALETLEEVRQLVESGKVVGVALACIKEEGGAVTSWSRCCGARLIDTLGAVQCLTARLYERLGN